MAFAIVHFTVGFVAVLAALSAVPVTRFRLTGAYLGGCWALVPDAHHLLDGPVGAWAATVHGTPTADAFFLHHTLDGAVYRAHNVELTALSLVALGAAFLAYDRRFGVGGRAAGPVDATGGSDEAL